MNNSFVIETEEGAEEVVDFSERLGTRESELKKIIEAIRVVSTSDGWRTLKKIVFDGVLDSLQRRLASEANKMPINEKEIYNLQGQIAWAKKYSNLDTLANTYKNELISVRLQLNPPTERDIAPDTNATHDD